MTDYCFSHTFNLNVLLLFLYGLLSVLNSILGWLFIYLTCINFYAVIIFAVLFLAKLLTTRNMIPAKKQKNPQNFQVNNGLHFQNISIEWDEIKWTQLHTINLITATIHTGCVKKIPKLYKYPLPFLKKYYLLPSRKTTK